MDNLEFAQYIKPSKLNRQKRRDKRLYKELIECRRFCGGDKAKPYREKSKKRQLQRATKRDTLPKRASYKPKPNITSQDDRLAPLIQLLKSSCGKLWDEVYSDLSKKLDKRSATGLHVYQHLWWFVDTGRIENGKLVFYDYLGRRTSPWKKWFYIHPTKGTLEDIRFKKNKGPYPKKARWKKAKQKAKIKRKLGIKEKPKTIFRDPKVATVNQLLKIDGIYDLKYQEIKDKSPWIKQRIQITNIVKKKSYQIQFKFIIKSDASNVVPNNLVIASSTAHWKIYDTGTFLIKTTKHFFQKNQRFKSYIVD